MIIKTHKELAAHIQGKKILHLNSLGKDSVVCLEWLTRYAKPSKIYSVFFEFLANHPDDERYWNYLKKRYPTVEFLKRPNTVELTLLASGIYQTPVQVNQFYNHWEFVEFERGKQIEELKRELGCDYTCNGSSKYESFARRTKFHQKGLVFKGEVSPLGMMTRDQVVGIIRDAGIKIHPCYKFSKGTYDHPSYWKMRAGWIARPEYREQMLSVYPLMVLDQYRYEVLLNQKEAKK
jgi:3'-phosphoadenosine 5'-phosphosulfate sulfotransferase (PAPS reductase)/FAD synthetase